MKGLFRCFYLSALWITGIISSIFVLKIVIVYIFNVLSLFCNFITTLYKSVFPYNTLYFFGLDIFSPILAYASLLIALCTMCCFLDKNSEKIKYHHSFLSLILGLLILCIWISISSSTGFSFSDQGTLIDKDRGIFVWIVTILLMAFTFLLNIVIIWASFETANKNSKSININKEEKMDNIDLDKK